MTSRLASIGLSVLLLGLVACSTTLFESMPTGTTTDCDPAWPGRWQPVSMPDDATRPNDVLEISADCRTVSTKSEGKSEPAHLVLINTTGGQFLQILNNGDPDCIGQGKAHCGFSLLRYERDGDTIRVFDPDHAKVAAAINRGSIKGFSEPPDAKALKSSQPTFRNFIAGDGKQIEKLLRQHPDLFVAEPRVVLQRLASAPTDIPDATAADSEP